MPEVINPKLPLVMDKLIRLHPRIEHNPTIEEGLLMAFLLRDMAQMQLVIGRQRFTPEYAEDLRFAEELLVEAEERLERALAEFLEGVVHA